MKPSDRPRCIYSVFNLISDGYELPSDGRQKVFPNGTLTISAASKSADEGYYTCTAFNRRDESDSGNVHIQVTSERASEPRRRRTRPIWLLFHSPELISFHFLAAPPTIMPFLFPNSLLNEGMRSAVSCQVSMSVSAARKPSPSIT